MFHINHKLIKWRVEWLVENDVAFQMKKKTSCNESGTFKMKLQNRNWIQIKRWTDFEPMKKNECVQQKPMTRVEV